MAPVTEEVHRRCHVTSTSLHQHLRLDVTSAYTIQSIPNTTDLNTNFLYNICKATNKSVKNSSNKGSRPPWKRNVIAVGVGVDARRDLRAGARHLTDQEMTRFKVNKTHVRSLQDLPSAIKLSGDVDNILWHTLVKFHWNCTRFRIVSGHVLTVNSGEHCMFSAPTTRLKMTSSRETCRG